MKRIVTFTRRTHDGRLVVNSISAPVADNEVQRIIGGNPNVGFIGENFTDPVHIEGKRIEMFYNPEQNIIAVEYYDITFDELDPLEKIDFLKNENIRLRRENEIIREEALLTQDALFEVDAKVEALMAGGMGNG